jgi:hypothetical protein
MYLEDALAQDVHRRRQADATVAHRVAAARRAADARQDADTLAAEPLPGEPLPVERPSRHMLARASAWLRGLVGTPWTRQRVHPSLRRA